MSIAVIIGRFQPLHNGHVALIEQALAENDQVLVLVGSVNKERDYKNPFTVEQRFEMIRSAFEGRLFTDGLNIRGLKDKPTDDEWVQEVIANVAQLEEDPSKVVLYTSEKDIEWYRANFLYNTVEADSGDIHATDIRKDLYTGCLKRNALALEKIPRENWDLIDSYINDRFWDFGLEMEQCIRGKKDAIIAHKFGNPIEPVAHAVVMHKGNILVVKRNSIRGKDQWAIPGGFMEATETTRQAAIRELKEETGVDLLALKVKEMAQAIEENIDDLSVRTLGINYLYLVAPEETIEVVIDEDEVSAYKWVDVHDVLTEREILFYNHNVVVQRLFSIVGEK